MQHLNNEANSQPPSCLGNANRPQQLQGPCDCDRRQNITPVRARQSQSLAQQQAVSCDYSRCGNRTVPQGPERRHRENVAPACPNSGAENGNGTFAAVAGWAAQMLGSGSLILNEIWQSLDGIKRIRKELASRAKDLKRCRQEVGRVRGAQYEEPSCGQRWKQELQAFGTKLLEWEEHNRRLGEVPSVETARLYDVTAKLLTRMKKELESAYRMDGENERLSEYVLEQGRMGNDENERGTMSGLRRWMSDQNLPEPPQRSRQPRVQEEPKLSDLGRWIRSRYPPAQEQAQQQQQARENANRPRGPALSPTGSEDSLEEQPAPTRYRRPGTQSRKNTRARSALLRSRAEPRNDERGQCSNIRAPSTESSSEENSCRPRECGARMPPRNNGAQFRNDDRRPARNLACHRPDQDPRSEIQARSPGSPNDSFDEHPSRSRYPGTQPRNCPRAQNGVQARTSVQAGNAARTWNDGVGHRTISPSIPPSPFAPYPDSDDNIGAYYHPRNTLGRLNNVYPPTNAEGSVPPGCQSQFSPSAGSDNVEQRQPHAGKSATSV